MSTQDDDLLQVNEHQWTRREPSSWSRLFFLVMVLGGIAGAIYLAI